MFENPISRFDRFLAQGIEAWKSLLAAPSVTPDTQLKIPENSSHNTKETDENLGLEIGFNTWTEILKPSIFAPPKMPSWYGSGPKDDPFPGSENPEI